MAMASRVLPAKRLFDGHLNRAFVATPAAWRCSLAAYCDCGFWPVVADWGGKRL